MSEQEIAPARRCACGCGKAAVTLRGCARFASHECRASFERKRAADERARDAARDGEGFDEAADWKDFVTPPKDDRPSLKTVHGRLFGDEEGFDA
jgi:hypothetical protein